MDSKITAIGAITFFSSLILPNIVSYINANGNNKKFRLRILISNILLVVSAVTGLFDYAWVPLIIFVLAIIIGISGAKYQK